MKSQDRDEERGCLQEGRRHQSCSWGRLPKHVLWKCSSNVVLGECHQDSCSDFGKQRWTDVKRAPGVEWEWGGGQIPPCPSLSSRHHPHTSECCCSLPDNFHGARVVVLFIHPHDKHGGIRRRCTDDHTLGTCFEVGLGKEHRCHEVLQVSHLPDPRQSQPRAPFPSLLKFPLRTGTRPWPPPRRGSRQISRGCLWAACCGGAAAPSATLPPAWPCLHHTYLASYNGFDPAGLASHG